MSPQPNAERGPRLLGPDGQEIVARPKLAQAMDGAFRGETHVAANAAEAAEITAELAKPGDVVLVKASRGVGLELVCRRLLATPPSR